MMSSPRRLLHRVFNAVRPSKAERDLTREVSSHLTLLEDEFQRRGMTPAEARVAARGVEQAKDLQHAMEALRYE
jgi:hypothetical protein